MDKYIASPSTLKSILSEYGVAIVPGVLNSDECDKMMSDMWDYLEHITANMAVPIKRTDSKTWSTYRELWPKHSMLLQHWNIGQSQLVWNVRQNPRVIAPFEVIWNCKASDLLSSFDGASFHLPPEKYGTGDQGWFRQLWMHTDQSYTRSVRTVIQKEQGTDSNNITNVDMCMGKLCKSVKVNKPLDNMECIQSWVTANDVHVDDATLAVLEGSHKLHGEFAKVYDIWDSSKTHNSDWYKLTQRELSWYTIEKKCPLVRITCNAGDMVLWDSRTIHCGVEPIKGRKNGPNFRNVVYTCYTPRALATPAILKKRIKAHEDMRTTNHWPHKPKLFTKYPRTYGNALPNVQTAPKPKLTPLGRRLVGYDS